MYHFTGPHRTWTLSRPEIALVVLLVIWELVWKGIALWKAGHHRQLAWFIVMLVLNTAGILEIVYILFFQAKPKTSKL